MSIFPREFASRYEVLEMMGQGGMGAVYKVRHSELDRICVIKVMRAQLESNSALRERFLGEAKKGAQVNHPNIASVLDFFVGSNGTACLVMEYIDGKNLSDVLGASKEPLNYKTVVEIVVQALDALAHLHAKKLVHRDISPDNLMITHDAGGKVVVKLIDLGIAKSLERTAGPGSTLFFVGKCAYAPPEQFGGHVDTRSDIYAMGVVLYELLTKTLPIVARDLASYYAAHQKTAPPRPFSETDPRGRVPESVRRVVLKALEKQPENRFQSAEEFREALQHAVVSGGTTIREAPITQQTAPASSAASRARTRAIGITTGSIFVTVFGSILSVMLGWLPVPWAPIHGAPPALSAAPSSTTLTVTDSTAAPRQPSDPKAAASAVTEGKRLADSGDLRGAFDAYDRATKADPSSAYAWANLGAAAAKLGRSAEAAQAYQRSLAIDSDNWLAHYNLGCLFARAGKLDEAYGHVERAVTQLRRQVRSPSELESFMESIRTDDALKELRNDRRFTALLAAN